MSSEDDFLLDDAADDAKTIAFIRNYLPATRFVSNMQANMQAVAIIGRTPLV